ncbi:hypothetical protein LguiA_013715 [Lonicera macranthoides]
MNKDFNTNLKENFKEIYSIRKRSYGVSSAKLVVDQLELLRLSKSTKLFKKLNNRQYSNLAPLNMGAAQGIQEMTTPIEGIKIPSRLWLLHDLQKKKEKSLKVQLTEKCKKLLKSYEAKAGAEAEAEAKAEAESELASKAKASVKAEAERKCSQRKLPKNKDPNSSFPVKDHQQP